MLWRNMRCWCNVTRKENDIWSYVRIIASDFFFLFSVFESIKFLYVRLIIDIDEILR